MGHHPENMPELACSGKVSKTRGRELSSAEAILFFFFFSLRLITSQYCSGFCHIDMNQPWIHMCSPSQSPLPPPSPSHPSGSSQCTNPEHLSHASNLGWWFVSPLIVYLFQCYSLRTSHPHILPQSPKLCSVHLCLFFCFAYRVIITIFLNSIVCVSILYWSLSFWFTSLCIMGSNFIHLIRTDSNEFFLMAE